MICDCLSFTVCCICCTILNSAASRQPCGPIAQSVEQVAFNHWVAGSSPARITNFFGDLRRLVGRLFLLVCELEFLVARGDTSHSNIVLASRERLASNNPLHPD